MGVIRRAVSTERWRWNRGDGCPYDLPVGIHAILENAPDLRISATYSGELHYRIRGWLFALAGGTKFYHTIVDMHLLGIQGVKVQRPRHVASSTKLNSTQVRQV
jgi:hypothetical protein